jgi:hypothetical protein
MGDFRKKPVVIQAVQFCNASDGDVFFDCDDLPEWLDDDGNVTPDCALLGWSSRNTPGPALGGPWCRATLHARQGIER